MSDGGLITKQNMYFVYATCAHSISSTIIPLDRIGVVNIRTPLKVQDDFVRFPRKIGHRGRAVESIETV